MLATRHDDDDDMFIYIYINDFRTVSGMARNMLNVLSAETYKTSECFFSVYGPRLHPLARF